MEQNLREGNPEGRWRKKLSKIRPLNRSEEAARNVAKHFGMDYPDSLSQPVSDSGRRKELDISSAAGFGAVNGDEAFEKKSA